MSGQVRIAKLSLLRSVVVKALKLAHLYRLTVKTIQKTRLGERANEALWRTRATTFYSQFIRRGDLCFDIGANIGSRVEVFYRLGAKVIAVEPHPECVKLLRAKYHIPEITVVEKAVGAKQGKGTLFINDKDSSISSMSTDWIEGRGRQKFPLTKWDNHQEVQITTLDSLIAEYGIPQFCKIDIEGYEIEAVKGLSQPIPYMSFEFCPELVSNAYTTIRNLDSLGMKWFNYSLGESMVMASNWQNAQDIFTVLARAEDRGDIYAAQKQKVSLL